ncbi:MAG TPA: hypothetical protein VFZ77_17195 [Acidimicrobiales bacterium]
MGNGSESGRTGGGAGPASSRRLVREPSRWSQLAAGAAVVVLTVAAVVSLAGGLGGTGERRGRGDRAGRSAAAVYVDAVAELGRARSFAYRGAVWSARPGPLRPGRGTAGDVQVEGRVLVPPSITREVAVDDRGRAVETVTSGPIVWQRGAASRAALAGAAWAEVPPPAAPGGWIDGERAFPPSRLGVALLPDILRAAGDPVDTEPDRTGRVLRADLPGDPRAGVAARCRPCDRYGAAVAGGEVRVSLRDGRHVARVLVRSPGPDPSVVLDLEIDRLGEPVVTPADVDEPARRSVPVGVLGAAGVAAVELGSLPPGWALTGASVGGTGGCRWLALAYRDLAAVGERWMSLGVRSETCATRGDRVGTGPVADGEPVRAGRFSGTAGDGTGEMSDGTTRVEFQTDLPITEVTGMLDALRPFDPVTPPAVAGPG